MTEQDIYLLPLPGAWFDAARRPDREARRLRAALAYSLTYGLDPDDEDVLPECRDLAKEHVSRVGYDDGQGLDVAAGFMMGMSIAGLEEISTWCWDRAAWFGPISEADDGRMGVPYEGMVFQQFDNIAWAMEKERDRRLALTAHERVQDLAVRKRLPTAMILFGQGWGAGYTVSKDLGDPDQLESLLHAHSGWIRRAAPCAAWSASPLIHEPTPRRT